MLIEHYPWIKLAHVAMVLASGALFALRGGAMLAASASANSTGVRWLSYAIDTALLATAVMLTAGLYLNPFTTPWLAAKLALLALYIVFGSLALRRGRTRARRAAWFAAALLVYAQIIGVARFHHPLGLLLLPVAPAEIVR